jgi:formate hydrogenlyase subunit 6/NADH:ubiquinone oxidoreductase subunit I
MTAEYELANYQRENFAYNKERLLR